MHILLPALLRSCGRGFHAHRPSPVCSLFGFGHFPAHHSDTVQCKRGAVVVPCTNIRARGPRLARIYWRPGATYLLYSKYGGSQNGAVTTHTTVLAIPLRHTVWLPHGCDHANQVNISITMQHQLISGTCWATPRRLEYIASVLLTFPQS